MFLLIVTVTSMLLAAIMSVVAWRIAVEERRRSDARVDALAAEIHGVSAPGIQPFAYRADEDLELRPAAASVPLHADPGPDLRADLFVAPQAPASTWSLATAAGIGVLVLGAAAALAVVTSAGAHGVGSRTAAGSAQPAPLVLVELDHERDGDRLTVRGVVRNPRSGAPMGDLTAVVFLFGRDGALVASGRATVESAPLGPGGESSFVVTVPGANDVGRFRVSFRTDDHLVSHVDKRHRG
jgi:hypothetical protein